MLNLRHDKFGLWKHLFQTSVSCKHFFLLSFLMLFSLNNWALEYGNTIVMILSFFSYSSGVRRPTTLRVYCRIKIFRKLTWRPWQLYIMTKSTPASQLYRRPCNARNTITAQLAIHSQERSVLFTSACKAVFCMPLANGFHSMRNTCLSL